MKIDQDFADFEEGAAMASQPFGMSGEPDEAQETDSQSKPKSSAGQSLLALSLCNV